MPPVIAPKRKKKREKDKYVQMCELEQTKMKPFWPCATAFFAGEKNMSKDVRMDESCDINEFMS